MVVAVIPIDCASDSEFQFDSQGHYGELSIADANVSKTVFRSALRQRAYKFIPRGHRRRVGVRIGGVSPIAPTYVGVWEYKGVGLSW